eukprot:284818667_4
MTMRGKRCNSALFSLASIRCFGTASAVYWVGKRFSQAAGGQDSRAPTRGLETSSGTFLWAVEEGTLSITSINLAIYLHQHVSQERDGESFLAASPPAAALASLQSEKESIKAAAVQAAADGENRIDGNSTWHVSEVFPQRQYFWRKYLCWKRRSRLSPLNGRGCNGGYQAWSTVPRLPQSSHCGRRMTHYRRMSTDPVSVTRNGPWTSSTSTRAPLFVKMETRSSRVSFGVMMVRVETDAVYSADNNILESIIKRNLELEALLE